MHSRTFLGVGILALAMSSGACSFSASVGNTPDEKKPDAKPTNSSTAPTPTAKASVPDAPKTPAPKVDAKPAKYEIPSSSRSAPEAPDSWDVVRDDDFGLQYRVPAHWNSETSSDANSNVFVAAAPDGSLLLSVTNFEGQELGDEEILETFLDTLGFQPSGPPHRVADGLVTVDGTGTDDDAGKVYFVAMVYAIGDVNYVAYMVTPSDQAEKNKQTMRQVLESFELI